MNDNFEYCRILFEKTLIGLALCRMNGELVIVNSAYAELLGRTIEETLELTYWEITPDKYAPQEKIQLESLEKFGVYGPYEKDYIHADGHLVPVRLSGQIVEIDGEKYIWSSIENITDRKQAEEKLARLYREVEELSLLDGLTGIANRRMFDQTLSREWEHAKRDASPLSLIMVDIDYFKQYNDHYGHIKGDECLKKIAKALSGVAKRGVDLVSRYGGEEFVLLLPETKRTQAIRLAKQCLQVVRDQKIIHDFSPSSNFVTISSGVSSLIPLGKMQPKTLVETADRLLYQAKQNGRNRLESSLV